MRRAVVPQVDEHLRRPAIRDGEGKRNGAAQVRFAPWVIRNRPGAPHLRDLRVAVDAKLCPTLFDYPKEISIVIVAGAHEVIEPIDTIRRLLPVNLKTNEALTCFEADVKNVWRAASHFTRIGIEEE